MPRVSASTMAVMVMSPTTESSAGMRQLGTNADMSMGGSGCEQSRGRSGLVDVDGDASLASSTAPVGRLSR